MRMRVMGALWVLGVLSGCGGVEPKEEASAEPAQEESGTRGQLGYPCNGTSQWYAPHFSDQTRTVRVGFESCVCYQPGQETYTYGGELTYIRTFLNYSTCPRRTLN
ncbi:hypothetical protein D7Y27_40550 [Corallococcus sp. AB004]|nr:hypothetical protein D7Y27_40550 [Corallococcus sp. AB004]